MDDAEVVHRFQRLFFKAWAAKRKDWLGVPIVKYPTDLFTYQMLIAKQRPDVIIETGAYWGGSALFFASLCDLVGHGRVISVDIKERVRPQHGRIRYVIGRSTADTTLAQVRDLLAGDTGMVTLDSDHRANHVKRELARYCPFVGLGQYLVVEDTAKDGHPTFWDGAVGPAAAVEWFLKRRRDFERVPEEDRFLLSLNPGGYLRRIA